MMLGEKDFFSLMLNIDEKTPNYLYVQNVKHKRGTLWTERS